MPPQPEPGAARVTGVSRRSGSGAGASFGHSRRALMEQLDEDDAGEVLAYAGWLLAEGPIPTLEDLPGHVAPG